MLEGKNAIVTGSTSGIGLGIAKVLAQKGCNVMLNGFGNPEEITNVQNSLANEFGVKVAFHGADMSKPEAIRDMVEQAIRKFGSLDILVNNAGIQHVAPIESFPEEKWNAIIAINLSAAFHAIKAALPNMQKNNFGRIINIASAHGLVGSAQKSAYVAAKHGVVGLTKVTALENATKNITANSICPGWVKTPLVEKQIADRSKAEKISIAKATEELLSEKQPSLDFVTVDQIGELVAFLASDEAKSITGIALPIDGGWTAR